MNIKENVAVIVGAGNGSRFGLDKIFIEIDNKPVWYYATKAFQDCDDVNEIILVVREENIHRINEKKELLGLSKVKKVVSGGKDRKNSVVNGLNEVDSFGTNLVLIHDAARPLVLVDLIKRCVDEAEKTKAAIPGTSIVDGIKKGKDEVLETVNRDDFRLVQTPQVFDFKLLKDAYDVADKDGFQGVDDASYVEHFGTKVSIVEGQNSNIKITYPEDLLLVDFFMSRRWRDSSKHL